MAVNDFCFRPLTWDVRFSRRFSVEDVTSSVTFRDSDLVDEAILSLDCKRSRSLGE